VRLADVYRVLFFDAERGRANGTDPAIEAILERAATGAAAVLDAPLRALADAPAVSSPR
jgi:hypothetical protein